MPTRGLHSLFRFLSFCGWFNRNHRHHHHRRRRHRTGQSSSLLIVVVVVIAFVSFRCCCCLLSSLDSSSSDEESGTCVTMRTKSSTSSAKSIIPPLLTCASPSAPRNRFCACNASFSAAKNALMSRSSSNSLTNPAPSSGVSGTTSSSINNADCCAGGCLDGGGAAIASKGVGGGGAIARALLRPLLLVGCTHRCLRVTERTDRTAEQSAIGGREEENSARERDIGEQQLGTRRRVDRQLRDTDTLDRRDRVDAVGESQAETSRRQVGELHALFSVVCDIGQFIDLKHN
jgi:hypothetical protein